MLITLYDLKGAGGERFSPHCWRARMALAHKGLEAGITGVNFIDITSIGDGTFKTVPVLDDKGVWVNDSFAIAQYLETTYPQAPSLFGSQDGENYARFVLAWANSTLHSAIVSMIIMDIHDRLTQEDQEYFRRSREKRFGKTLEHVQQGREHRLEEFRARLTPVRLMLKSQPFLGGAEPQYTDYILFGSLQWARVSSSFQLLEPTDPVQHWFERCLDLHGGIGRAALV